MTIFGKKTETDEGRRSGRRKIILRLLLSVVTLVTRVKEQTFVHHSTQYSSETALLCLARNWVGLRFAEDARIEKDAS